MSPAIWVVMFVDYGFEPIAWFADELEARRWADINYVDGKIGRWEQGETWPPPDEVGQALAGDRTVEGL